MRTLATTLALLLAGAPALGAQQGRISLAAFAGFYGSGPVFHHSTRIEDPALVSSSDERLTLDHAFNFGARIGYAVAPRWTLSLNAAYAGSHLRYTDTVSLRVAAGTESSEADHIRAPASAVTLTVEAGRSFPLSPAGTELELGLGGGIQYLSLPNQPVSCPEFAPGAGGGDGSCHGPGPWEERNTVPSAVGSLALRHPVGRHLALEARSSLLVGRVNTESFHQDFQPGFEQFEAPRSQMLRTMQATVGLSWRP